MTLTQTGSTDAALALDGKHALIDALRTALGWDDASALGREFGVGELPDGLAPRLFGVGRMYELISSRNLEPPQFRCFRNGSELRPSEYLSRTATGYVPDPRRLSHLLDQGCTIILNAVEAIDPTLEVACRALQWWSRELVQVNAYLTTGATAGFSMHWDGHEVLVVQVAGDKEWEVGGLARRFAMPQDAGVHAEPPSALVWKGTLSTGSVMHIPRGQWHYASRSTDGYSLHLTFSIMKQTGVDWARWLADRTPELDSFRHDLPRDGETLTRVAKALGAELPRLAKSHGPENYLEARENDIRTASRHIYSHAVSPEPDSVVCVSDFSPKVRILGDGTIEVVGAGSRLLLRERAHPAVRAFLSGWPTSVADASAAIDADASPIAQALLKEGLCTECTAAVASGYDGLRSA